MYTKKKKRVFRLLGLLYSLVFASMLLLSCAENTEDVSIAANAGYVSSVSFNNMRRVATIKASDGVTDSTCFVTYSATSWSFTIDHKTLSIENRDSLPYSTDLSRVVMNLAYSGGAAYHRASDAWADDAWITYNAEDSIDIRKPLHIKIVATDNTERIYTLRVNVHTVEGETMRWTSVGSDELIGGQHPMKAVALEDRVAVLVNDGNSVSWVTHGLAIAGAWERHVTDLPKGADVKTLSKGKERVFVNTDAGELYASSNGLDWEMLYQHDGLRMVGVSNDKLYATFDNAVKSIYIGASEWKTETLDDDYSLMPDKEIATMTYAQNKELTRMIIVGNRSVDTDTEAVVWSKCWTNFEDEDKESWMFYTRNWDNTQQMPMLTQMNLIHYDNMLMMVGGKSYDGKIQAMDRFLVSKDNGLTWWRQQTFAPPAELKGVEGHIAATVDKDKFIWLIAGGKVFRGRQNRLGFVRPGIN